MYASTLTYFTVGSKH